MLEIQERETTCMQYVKFGGYGQADQILSDRCLSTQRYLARLLVPGSLSALDAHTCSPFGLLSRLRDLLHALSQACFARIRVHFLRLHGIHIHLRLWSEQEINMKLFW